MLGAYRGDISRRNSPGASVYCKFDTGLIANPYLGNRVDSNPFDRNHRFLLSEGWIGCRERGRARYSYRFAQM